MKKLLSLFLALLLTLSLAACGSEAPAVDLSGKDLIQPSPVAEAAPSAEPETSEEPAEASAEPEKPEPPEPVVLLDVEDSGEYKIGILSNGACAIVGYSGKSEYLELPDTLNDLPVISIGEKTFYGNSNIKTLVIPGCITDIGKEAFASCKNLSALTLNEGLLTIGESAFQGCEKLLAVKLPDSVVNIGGFAFKGCKKLQELKLPANIEAIEHCTFAQCASLENVELPDSLRSVGAWAFAWTPWQDGLVCNGEWLVLGQGAAYIYTGSGGEVVVPVDYQSYEFNGNTRVTSISLSEGILSVPAYACEALTGLQSISIPSTIQSIGECAFRNTRVGELFFSEGLVSIGKSAFEGSGNVTLHLPDSVSFIDEEAFLRCSSVTFICSPGSYAAQYAEAHGFSVCAP